MALSKQNFLGSYTLAGTAENGADLSAQVDKTLGDYYIKVASVNGGKDGGRANVLFMVEINGDKQVSFAREYAVPLSVADGSGNFIAQTYAHLKTLPEFNGAVDC